MQNIKMKVWYFPLLVAVLFICSAHSYAQQTVSGTVKEMNGDPIIGASVVVKGTNIGTVTDLDGNFKLTVPDKGKILVVSYIGMQTKEIPVIGTVVNVSLEENMSDLDEVVVIGYGTVKKRDLTGSVSSIGYKQLEAVPVANVSEALTGKLPGVSIVTTEGSPDADIKIRVRGGGSLSQDNSPLYIVDGFQVSTISDVVLSEIQTIDVLKDASSTAIYGSRGANGVIIITTKSGREGKTQVSLGISHGLRKATKLVKTLSPYDYAMYQYELGSTDYGKYSDLDIWKSIKGTDYQEEIFGRTGNQTQYNVNVGGGTKSVKYSVTYARNEEKSIMLSSGFKKDNINAKINTDLNKNLSLDFNARFSYQTLDGLSGGADVNESNAASSIVAGSVRFRPINPLAANTDDDESNTNRQYNPLERMNAVYKQKRDLNQTYNAGLNWKITTYLMARSEFAYSWRYTDTDQVWETPATSNSKFGHNGRPQAVLLTENRTKWKNANTITYDNKKVFDGRDNLNILLGHEVSGEWLKTKESTTVDFPTTMTVAEILAAMGNGTALPNKTNIGAKDNMLSYFGRINYTFNEKYIFTATMRADGSAKFAKENRWGYFPSAAVAWRMSDESFIEGTRQWLSNLKWRLSYGTAGNNRIPSGAISSTYSLSDNSAKAPFFNEVYNAMLEQGKIMANPDLKWETTVTRNIGLDYGFRNNKISGTIDLYWNTTKDLLMKMKIASHSGYDNQYQNFGQTSNRGVELALNAILADRKDFGLDFNFNISYNANKIDKLSQESPWQSSNWSGSTIAKYEDFKVEEGGRLGEVWGYKTNGFFTVYDQNTNPNGELVWKGSAWGLRDGLKDNSAAITGGSYYPGGLKLHCDEKGDPLKQRLGNTVAPVYGGFGLNGRYKNFDLSIFFNYSLGNVIINGTKLATSFYSGSARGYNLNDDFALGKRYATVDPQTGLSLGRGLSNSTITQYGGIENVINRLNEINTQATVFSPYTASTMQLTDYAVEDASFLRLNNVNLGYTFSKPLTNLLRLQTVRFYITAYNLLCFTKYTGSDPEVDTSSKNNKMTPGIDYAAYPKSRSFVFGINVTF